jgi:hypothetical protein
VHWVGQVRYPQAVYHAMWDGSAWSTPEPFYLISRIPEDPIGDRIHAHNVRLGIRDGNQLAASFTDVTPPMILVATHRTLEDVPPTRIVLPDLPWRRVSPQLWVLLATILVAVSSALARRRVGSGAPPVS